MGNTSPSSRQINQTPEACNVFDVNVSPSRQPRASHEGHQGIFKITLSDNIYYDIQNTPKLL